MPWFGSQTHQTRSTPSSNKEDELNGHVRPRQHKSTILLGLWQALRQKNINAMIWQSKSPNAINPIEHKWDKLNGQDNKKLSTLLDLRQALHQYWHFVNINVSVLWNCDFCYSWFCIIVFSSDSTKTFFDSKSSTGSFQKPLGIDWTVESWKIIHCQHIRNSGLLDIDLHVIIDTASVLIRRLADIRLAFHNKRGFMID